jgi:dTDP-4-dehydrorhamnose 3,5-epimerase
MQVKATELQGVIIIEPEIYRDSRGYFFESWNVEKYKDSLPFNFVQDNISYSRKGVLRGMHFQNPRPQAKLVSVLYGEIFDVIVDLRLGSPTFKKWFGLYLSSQNHRQLFIPEGYAHGFIVTADEAIFHYKCSGYYSPIDELGIVWNDPELNINWPIENPIVSSKDKNASLLKEIPEERLFAYQTVHE